MVVVVVVVRTVVTQRAPVGSVLIVRIRAWTSDPGAFTIKVSTDRSAYRVGQSVQLSAKVCSRSLMPQMMSTFGGPGLTVTWRILDVSGQVVADSSHAVYTMEKRQMLFAPRCCRSWRWPEGWDMRYWNQPGGKRESNRFGTPARGTYVPAGEYRVEAEWRANPWDDRRTPAAVTHTAVSDEFTVEVPE